MSKKTFFKSLIVFICLAAYLPAEAEVAYLGEGLQATAYDESCATTPGDPYEYPARFTDASDLYEDYCVDTDRFRSAEIIEDTSEKIVFANFEHKDQFWIAELSRKTIVEQVYFQIIRFNIAAGVVAAHTQLRMRFEPGSEIKLRKEPNGEVVDTVNDFVISFEASRPYEKDYNFALGATNNYALVGRVLSGEQRLSETATVTEQYALDILSETEKLDLVISAIQKSHNDKQSRVYNTIRPNCTTEAFDLLDQLSSIAETNAKPFLTVISPDPIATPSIAALTERGILLGLAPSLRDEIEDGQVEPITEVPESELLDESIFPKVEDRPYSLVAMSSEAPDYESELAKEEGLKIIRDLIPGLLQAVGSAAMSSGASLETLVGSLKAIAYNIGPQLEELNENLPDEPVYVRLYFVPWRQEAGVESNPLETSSLPARLPFKSFVADESDWTEVGTIKAGIKGALETRYGVDDRPYFIGASIVLRLQRDNAQAELQFLTGLQTLDLSKPIAENDQIILDQIVIPEVSEVTSAPVMLARLGVIANSDPVLRLEFGPGLSLQPKSIKFQIDRDLEGCTRQAESTPALIGVFGDEAVSYDGGGLGSLLSGGVSALLSGRKAVISIFAMDFDIESLLIKKMDLRIASTWPIECQVNDGANKQFATEANAVIEKMKQDLEDETQSREGLLELLSRFLSQNTEDEFSGME